MLRFLVLACLMPVLLLSAACGTATFDMTTTVLSPDEAEQQVSIRAEGPLGEALGERLKPEDLEREGWKADIKGEREGLQVNMTKRGPLDSIWDLPDDMPGATGAEATVDVVNGLLSREYRAKVVLPADAMGSQLMGESGLGADQQRQIQQMMAQAIKMTWTINLPGEITETNADHRTANGGTWDLTFDRTAAGMELLIASREGPSLPALAGGATVAVVAAALGWYAYNRGRRFGTGPEEGEAEGPAQPPVG